MMKLCHRCGGYFQFVKVLKRKYLHRNVLTTREVFWVNLLTKYLIYFFIITCASAVKNIVSTHKHVILFTCTMNFSRDVNMWKMKSNFFNFWNLIFWMKIQNAAWFQYKTFPCFKSSLIGIFYINAWRTCFAMLIKWIFCQ